MSLNYNNPRKNPPAFSSLKSYEQWKKEVNGWTRLTTENEKDWAHLIALGCLSPDDPSMMAATSLKCSCWNGGTLNNGVNHLWHSLCIPIFFVFSLFNAFAPSDNGSQSQNPCSIHLFQDWSYICEMIPFLLGQIIVLFQDPLQWDFCCRLWFSSCNNWCKWRRSWWSAGKQSFDKLSNLSICMKAK